jgi:hypothetical protein
MPPFAPLEFGDEIYRSAFSVEQKEMLIIIQLQSALQVRMLQRWFY